MTTNQKVGYSVPEAAKMLGLSRATGYLRAADGSLPVRKIGKRLIVPAWFISEFEKKSELK